ncbi:PH domain-containing protein [Demequina zhanjiangensis]|uniref:PH domain-containing protein n=1 Tax=Demequina zhanjiangensis TaxID=3051659 RepID=A0ABT8FYL3_9MICO|nr:PH domain-containing protein [Demequina sp. SYSU T00b26]MDN4471990.1 PH domain-containing protein [Demequina sp. SYSU T00b26]
MTWFEPEGASWTYVDRRLIPARLLSFGIPLLLLLVATAVPAVMFGGLVWLAPAAVAIILLWTSWIVVRQVGAHAWAEREDDLLVKRGRMFKRVTVVPYGRMQFVEVEAGPLARAFGIARVQLHTAAPGTDASIAGVPTDEAARLRDRLTARGEATLAGL